MEEKDTAGTKSQCKSTPDEHLSPLWTGNHLIINLAGKTDRSSNLFNSD